MSQDYLARIAALEDALRQKDSQLSLVAETESFLRSALARVLTAKYCEHLPLYRQCEIFARQGVDLSRALLSNWVDACCRLMAPLDEALYRYVMDCRKLHTDDTPVPVLAPGRKKTKTGRIWTYVRDDRSAGSSDPPAAWFAFSPDRQGKHPQQQCRLNGIDPEAYLRYTLSVLPEWPSNKVAELLPWNVDLTNK
ncbi:transposase [Salmonella enterica]|nr:transposase [Salmonella enterica]